GKLTRIDEAAVLAEIRESVPAYLAQHARIEELNQPFEPYFAEIHRRASLRHSGTYRYAGDAPAWPTNREGR
ncbi:amidohydrolase, partial [Rhizobiaceae sp. 2RAB30]